MCKLAHSNMVWFLYTDITVTLGDIDNGTIKGFHKHVSITVVDDAFVLRSLVI